MLSPFTALCCGSLLLWCLSGSALGASALERLVTPGPLHALHAELEANCSACHAPGENAPAAAFCTACHSEVGEDVANKKGFHGRRPTVRTASCEDCHREHEGRDGPLNPPAAMPFDHLLTDFPLDGAHTSLACVSCHEPLEPKRAAPTQCAACHGDADPHQGALGQQCGQCHDAVSWTTTRFDHGSTRFPLVGAHQTLACGQCHDDQRFVGASRECSSCHQKDDVHQGTFGTACASCHGPISWTAVSFDHRWTGFVLTGAHESVPCDACHAPGAPATEIASECSACHLDDDVHDGRNGSDCARCHGTVDWRASDFDHQSISGFALLGKHAVLTCEQCHGDSVSAPLETTCAGCHQDPHEGQLGPACDDCHDNLAWGQSVRFDHAFAKFPLLGKHLELVCRDCHFSLRFLDAESECVDCHRDDDPHGGAFGAACGDCHSEVAWTGARFDHEQETGFPLRGVHASLSCASCHRPEGLMFVTSADDCVACHRADDVHGGSFGTACQSCHSVNAFVPARVYP